MREKALSWWNSLSEGEKRIKYADYFNVTFTEVHFEDMDDISLDVVYDVWSSLESHSNTTYQGVFAIIEAFKLNETYTYGHSKYERPLNELIMANLDPSIFIDEAIDKFKLLGYEGVKFAILETLKEKGISKKKLARTLRKWIKEIESRRFETLDDPKIQLHKVFKEVLEEIKNK